MIGAGSVNSTPGGVVIGAVGWNGATAPSATGAELVPTVGTGTVEPNVGMVPVVGAGSAGPNVGVVLVVRAGTAEQELQTRT
jgi:hypothetical protein